MLSTQRSGKCPFKGECGQETTEVQYGILPRIADLGEPSKVVIRCTISQAVHLEQRFSFFVFFYVCSDK